MVTIPFLFVAQEAWQGVVYTGFNWRLLGHSQWNVLPMIQIADIFGVLGISVLVAAVNGLIAGLIIDAKDGKVLRVRNYVKAGIALILVAGTLGYGHWRLTQSEECISEGPMLGSVQPNIPSDIKETPESGDMILKDLLEMSVGCFDAGADFVGWPETIVLSSLNRGYVSLCREGTRPVKYDRMISEHTRNRGHVILGAHTAIVAEDENQDYKITDRYNSAFLYGPDGKQSLERYDKIHLVPFGEYIPFKESAPFIYRFILKFSPYDYDYNLTKGTNYTTFDIEADGRTYGCGVLICYEDTDHEVTRKMVVSASGEKKADWLLNISNDGWYVRYKDEKVIPSAELIQRTVITVFRAVENRVSVIRSVNTGISCLIDSTGRIRDGFVSGTLPEAIKDRQGVEGWFVDRVGIDDRVTFFSRHGQFLDVWFRWGIVGLLLFMIAEKKLGRFGLEKSNK